jgi:hypothetical protein
LGLVLFDLVPAEKRESLIDGIRQMIRGPELPEIPRGLGGTLGGGWRVNIGPLKESKALEAFEWIEGSIGQDFDFCYFLTFRCILRPDLRNTLEEGFLKAGEWVSSKTTGPEGAIETRHREQDLEPTIRLVQKQLETFLSKFLPGIYISAQSEKATVKCPSARILVADHIDFDNFQTWFREHTEFMLFLGMGFAASRLGPYLLSYQPDRVISESGMFAGLNIVISRKALPKPSENEGDSFMNASSTFISEIVPLFEIVYWVQFARESILPGWSTKADPLNSRLDELLHGNNLPSLHALMPYYREAIRLFNEFEGYSIDETRRIDLMKNSSMLKRGMKSTALTGPIGIEIDILADLNEGAVKFIDEEDKSLKHVLQKIRSLSEQYQHHADFALQRGMSTLTKVALAISVGSFLAAVIAIILRFY